MPKFEYVTRIIRIVREPVIIKGRQAMARKQKRQYLPTFHHDTDKLTIDQALERFGMVFGQQDIVGADIIIKPVKHGSTNQFTNLTGKLSGSIA